MITEAGTDPNVAGLVYIAAFAPDKGESVASLIKDPPPGAPVPPILPPQDGFLFLDKAKFAASFAADVRPGLAAFMADAQVPWGVEALTGAITRAGVEDQAELVPGRDRRPDDPARRAARDVQARGATVVEVKGSHSVYVSQPQPVAGLIEHAAKSLAPAAR